MTLDARQGDWCGVSQPIVHEMRWTGQWLGEPSERRDISAEVVDFVYAQRGVERALAPLRVPETCGVSTCGVDVAIVRAQHGALEVRILELNARTTLSHYALAAKRRVPHATRFDVLRVSEARARSNLVCLTDPETAHSFVAAVTVQPPDG